MNASQYERYVAKKMRRRGYIFVSVTGRSGDYGCDVMARTIFFRKVVVQCKFYSHAVGVRAVQEAISAKAYYRASKAIVATNSYFTKPAQKLAKKCGVIMWEKF